MKPIKITASRTVWSCPWYSVRQDEIENLAGARGVYNVVQLPGASWIIPVTTTGDILLIRTYRHTVQAWCYEIPAGGIKPPQSAAETAKTELLEEVGGTAAQIDYIGQFYTMNGIGDEVAHIFLATDVQMGQTEHEPMEIIEIHPTPIADALQMVYDNKITDSVSALALLLCAERLRGLAKQAGCT